MTEPPAPAVLDLAASLSSTLDLDELSTLVVQRVSRLLGAMRSALYLVDQETGELYSRSAQGAQAPIRLSRGMGLVGWVAEHGEALRSHAPYDDPRFVRTWDQASGFKTDSLLAVPVVNPAGAVVAVLACVDKPGGFDDGDQALLESVARPCALAVTNGLVVRGLERRNEELARAEQELQLGYRLERELDTAADEPAALELVLTQLRAFLDAPAAAGFIGGDLAPALLIARATGVEARPITPDFARVLLERFAGKRFPSLLALDQSAGAKVATAAVPLGNHRVGAIQVVLGSRAERDRRSELVSVTATRMGAALGARRERLTNEHDERLALVGQMMSGVVHDLRGPMSAALGYTDLLAEERDPAQQGYFAGQVRTALRQMDDMVQEILQFARGDFEIVVRSVDIGRFLASVLDQLRPDLERFGAVVSTEGDTGGTGRFDVGKLRRVVANLARNAGQAGAKRVVVRVEQRPDRLVLRVEDDGPGIPDALRGRLFLPFATFGKAGGTGLGLAMARRIVEAHAGRLELVATGPSGTAFEISLPPEPTPGALLGGP